MRHHYTFRAEAPCDLDGLVALLPERSLISWHLAFNSLPVPHYNCHLVLRDVSLEEVRALMKRVVDGHVMRRTLKTVIDIPHNEALRTT